MINKDEHTNELFTSAGCLSLTALGKYIDKMLTEKERKLVEIHISECELCADAIAGTEYIPDSGSLISDINEINQNIQTKLQKKKPGKTRLYAITSIAATLLLLLGLFIIFNKQENVDTLVAETETMDEDHSKPIQPPQKEQVSEKDQEQPADLGSGAQVRSTDRLLVEEKETILQEKGENQVLEEMEISDISIVENHEALPVELEIIEDEIAKEEILFDEAESANNDLVVTGYVELKDDLPAEQDVVKERDETYLLITEDYKAGRANRLKRRAKSAAPATRTSEIDKTEEELAAFGKVEIEEIEDYILYYSDEMPKFEIEGYESFEEWVLSQLSYPDTITLNSLEGKVYIEFIIDKKGIVKEVKVLNGLHTDIDNEVIKIVKKSPKWIPGTKNNKEIDVKIEMPIEINIDGY